MRDPAGAAGAAAPFALRDSALKSRCEFDWSSVAMTTLL
jgi:hypothetical protein